MLPINKGKQKDHNMHQLDLKTLGFWTIMSKNLMNTHTSSYVNNLASLGSSLMVGQKKQQTLDRTQKQNPKPET